MGADEVTLGRKKDPPSELRVARRMQLIERRHAEFGEQFNSIEHARSTGRAHAIFIGDCHLRVIHRAVQTGEATTLIPHAWCDPCIVGGATAHGLANPNSESQAGNIFRRRIEFAEKWQHLVFMLGEADTGFMIWYRTHQLGESIAKLGESLDPYLAFLREVHEQGFEKMIVLSSPATPGHRRIRRQKFEVTQEDRTELTMRWNQELADRAGDMYTYVDVTTPTLDPATGLVKPEYIDPHDQDHLLSEPYGLVIAEQLRPLLTPP